MPDVKLGAMFVDMVLDKNGEFAVALKRAEGNARRSGNQIQNALSGLKNFVAGLGIAAAVSASIKAHEESAAATGKLASALAAAGEESQKATEALKAHAAEIMKITVFDDDAVVSAMAYAKGLGMQTNMLKDASVAAVGLATRLNINLDSAMQLIQKASSGNVMQLQRLGVQFEANATNAEKLQAVLKFGAQGFKMAEEYAQTAAGKMEQFRNAIGEASENLGGALLPLLKALIAIGKPLLEWLAAIPTTVVSGILQIGAVAFVLYKVFEFTKALIAAWKGWAVTIAFVKGLTKDWIAVGVAVAAAAATYWALARVMSDANEESRKIGDGNLNLEGQYTNLTDSVNKSTDAISGLKEGLAKLNKDNNDPYREQAERLAQIIEQTKDATKAEQERKAAMVGTIQVQDISRKAMETGLKERFNMALDFQGAAGPNVNREEGGLIRSGLLPTRPQIEAAYVKMQREDNKQILLTQQLLSYVKEIAYSSTWGKKYGEAF